VGKSLRRQFWRAIGVILTGTGKPGMSVEKLVAEEDSKDADRGDGDLVSA